MIYPFKILIYLVPVSYFAFYPYFIEKYCKTYPDIFMVVLDACIYIHDVEQCVTYECMTREKAKTYPSDLTTDDISKSGNRKVVVVESDKCS